MQLLFMLSHMKSLIRIFFFQRYNVGCQDNASQTLILKCVKCEVCQFTAEQIFPKEALLSLPPLPVFQTA